MDNKTEKMNSDGNDQKEYIFKRPFLNNQLALYVYYCSQVHTVHTFERSECLCVEQNRSHNKVRMMLLLIVNTDRSDNVRFKSEAK